MNTLPSNNNLNSEYDVLFKILFLGDSGVGKSCIILRYTENQFNPNLMNSIGVDFKLKIIDLEDKSIKLQIWDTAGQERFRTITTSYYRGASTIAIVYDITDKESFEHVRNWMNDIDRFAKENVLKFLVGNKCDIDKKRAVTYEEGRELGLQYNMPFMETSAKDSINIEELFISATKNFLEKNAYHINKRVKKKINNNIIHLEKNDKNPEEKKDNCC